MNSIGLLQQWLLFLCIYVVNLAYLEEMAVIVRFIHSLTFFRFFSCLNPVCDSSHHRLACHRVAMADIRVVVDCHESHTRLSSRFCRHCCGFVDWCWFRRIFLFSLFSTVDEWGVCHTQDPQNHFLNVLSTFFFTQ